MRGGSGNRRSGMKKTERQGNMAGATKPVRRVRKVSDKKPARGNKILKIDYPTDPNCSDFTLKDNSCWITVGNRSVYIVKLPAGLRVAIYKKGKEMETELDSAFAYKDDE